MFVRRLAALAFFSALAAVLRAQSTVPAPTQPIPGQTLAAGTSSVTLDLKNYFSVPGVSGQIAQFDTVLGKFDAELLANDAPKTVQNFLNYVNNGRFANTFFHRSVSGFVIQAGGFVLSGNNVNAVATDAPVQNEYKLSNLRGTIAMAKLGPPTGQSPTPDTINSATSQWFVNLADNSATLNNQNGGFTVFARVLGTGMTVADAIAAVRVYNASSFNNAFTEIPLLHGSLTPDDLVVVRSIKVVPLFRATSGDDAFVSFAATSSNPGIATAAVNGTQLVVNVLASGSAIITVRATDVNGNMTATSFTVTNGQPIITVQPLSQTVAPGGGATFNVVATGTGALSYQWRKNGAAIAGATTSTFSLANLTADASADYTVMIGSATGAETSRVARLTVATPDPGRLANLSVRTAMSDGQTLIVGVTMSGGARNVLVRAAGPALANFGLTTAMADPRLDLFSGQTLVLSNDDWNVSLRPAFASVGAFDFQTGSKDAALTQSISGGYTIQARGTAAGVVLVEAYDLGAGNAPRLTNVSARNVVGTGDNILIAGFTVSGNVPKKLLIRGVGPTLASFGVSGALADPKLEIYSGNTLVARTDNWGDEPQPADIAATASAVGAFALGPGSKDAAFVITLPAGGYTAQIAGVGGATGEALVEIYEVP